MASYGRRVGKNEAGARTELLGKMGARQKLASFEAPHSETRQCLPPSSSTSAAKSHSHYRSPVLDRAELGAGGPRRTRAAVKHRSSRSRAPFLSSMPRSCAFSVRASQKAKLFRLADGIPGRIEVFFDQCYKLLGLTLTTSISISFGAARKNYWKDRRSCQTCVA